MDEWSDQVRDGFFFFPLSLSNSARLSDWDFLSSKSPQVVQVSDRGSICPNGRFGQTRG